MKKSLLLLIAGLQSLFALSQAPQSWTSADMFLALRKLNVLGSVLYVAAHPDDENTRLITYFSKDKLYRTGYLSLTRGDGGQNLIGDEQGVELGLMAANNFFHGLLILAIPKHLKKLFRNGIKKKF